ncbi:hypothetical protein TURU_105733 [Turdus rufiventris]|nr:hypothetical protein TURU_105733 [Turdus rufiventris]
MATVVPALRAAFFSELRKPFGWKTPLRSSGPTRRRTPPCRPDHGTECHVELFLEHRQGRFSHLASLFFAIGE